MIDDAINLTEVEERLRASDLKLKTVAGVYDFAELRAAPGQLPAGYVVPLEETAGPSEMFGSGAHQQTISVNFGIALVVSRPQVMGAPGRADLRELTIRLRRLFEGWTPAGATAPIEYAGGRLLSVNGGAATWLARFRSTEVDRLQAG
jgi:hypothetical protein